MALYKAQGTISDFTEVKSGQTTSGKTWQRMDLILEMEGFQNSIYKMVFQVSGDRVNDVLLFNRGDKVDVAFAISAREWEGRWFNNVELVKIQYQEGCAPRKEEKVTKATPETDGDGQQEDLPF